jgi:uncharacterized DUF497 family protein
VFEWDARKAEANFRKHGVSFDEAATSFDDPRGLSGEDLQHSDTESRWRWIGRSADERILIIAYTLRRAGHGKTAIRIISARRANRKERAAYEAD